MASAVVVRVEATEKPVETGVMHWIAGGSGPRMSSPGRCVSSGNHWKPRSAYSLARIQCLMPEKCATELLHFAAQEDSISLS